MGLSSSHRIRPRRDIFLRISRLPLVEHQCVGFVVNVDVLGLDVSRDVLVDGAIVVVQDEQVTCFLDVPMADDFDSLGVVTAMHNAKLATGKQEQIVTRVRTVSNDSVCDVSNVHSTMLVLAGFAVSKASNDDAERQNGNRRSAE